MIFLQNTKATFVFCFLLFAIFSLAQENAPPGQPAMKHTAGSSAKKQMSGLKLPPASGKPGEAKNNFLDGNYRAALSEYISLLQKEPDNPLYLYRAAVSYLNGNIDFEKAATFFEKAISNNTIEKDIYFQLARAQHLTYKFDDAIKNYTKGIEISKDKELIFRATRNIEMCNNAKILMRNPVNVTIENLGPEVNSTEPDYYPFVDDDETFLIYSTRRAKGNVGYMASDGFFTADIFISTEKNGKWKKAKGIGPIINTAADEEIVGLLSNGEIIFINLDSQLNSGDITYSEKKGKQYQQPKQLPLPVNTEFMEITAFTTEDKQTLFFASERPEGFGGSDLYISRKLPTGEWSAAMNLGENINTEYHEYFPVLSKDGKTFYFSSEGHNSMGGFDLFKSKWSEKDSIWGKPVNIGYPISTPDDDLQICFNVSGTTAYISSFRKGSVGDLDIYSVTFHDMDVKPTILKVKTVQKISIDYSDYMTFHIYEKEGVLKKFPESYLPKDAAWKLKETKKEGLKPGHRFSVFITLEKDGEEKRFSLEKVPQDSSYIFKDIRISQVPVAKYKPPAKSRPTHTSEVVKDAFISVSVKSTGALHGDYLPNPNTGRYILDLPPGDYTISVTADGFKDYAEDISVTGKASFKDEIEKNIILKPMKEPAPVHYSSLKKE